MGHARGDGLGDHKVGMNDVLEAIEAVADMKLQGRQGARGAIQMTDLRGRKVRAVGGVELPSSGRDSGIPQLRLRKPRPKCYVCVSSTQGF